MRVAQGGEQPEPSPVGSRHSRGIPRQAPPTPGEAGRATCSPAPPAPARTGQAAPSPARLAPAANRSLSCRCTDPAPRSPPQGGILWQCHNGGSVSSQNRAPAVTPTEPATPHALPSLGRHGGRSVPGRCCDAVARGLAGPAPLAPQGPQKPVGPRPVPGKRRGRIVLPRSATAAKAWARAWAGPKPPLGTKPVIRDGNVLQRSGL